MEESDNRTQSLGRLFSTDRRRGIIVTIFWAGIIAAVFSRAMFQKTYPETLDYAEIVVACLAAGALMQDFQRALLGCLAAIAIGLSIVFVLATTAVSLGGVPSNGVDAFQGVWFAIIFQSVFPFPLVEFLAAAMVGSLLGERFLQ